jgi:Na+/melibiose symporter-like transporter
MTAKLVDAAAQTRGDAHIASTEVFALRNVARRCASFVQGAVVGVFLTWHGFKTGDDPSENVSLRAWLPFATFGLPAILAFASAIPIGFYNPKKVKEE